VNWIELILLCTFAFLPPILYAIWFRNTERYNREKWKPLIACFLWGATIAVVASIILEFILGVSLAISIQDASVFGLIIAIIIAPFVEELTKPLALRMRIVKRELDELEDGLIYGAVAGLGFSATENLLYGWSFLSYGLLFFFVLITIRSVGACLLHASATALTGYGYGIAIMKKTSVLRILPFFLLAVFVHAFYNFLVSFRMIGVVSGLFAALFFVLLTLYFVRQKIKMLDSLQREPIFNKN
jgi:RsiW-degrading membrane proteinase PrsW (M82 family)